MGNRDGEIRPRRTRQGNPRSHLHPTPRPVRWRGRCQILENFEEVRAQAQVLRVLDSEHIEMVVHIPERYISLVRFVEDINVIFDAIKDAKLPAEISEVGNEASPTTRTFPVTLQMEQLEGKRVYPGMTGRASGQLKKVYEPYSGIVVPAAAVFVPEGKEQSHVWVVDKASMTVSPRPVELSQPRTNGLSIESGLEPGDIVVTAGANSLRDGQKVNLLNPEGGG
ncbi:MAG: efflux RND transporter periplasmic adaptor subunit [Rhizobiaceae bacterium]